MKNLRTVAEPCVAQDQPLLPVLQHLQTCWVQCAPSPQSLMEMLNSSGFTISPWRTALMSSPQLDFMLLSRIPPAQGFTHFSVIAHLSHRFVYENIVRDIKSQDKPQPLLFSHPLSHSYYTPTIRFQMCF